MSHKNLPNFLIVGAAKSGTTSLYHYLNQHSQIFMPEFKEPQFFVTKKVSKKIHRYIDNENEYFHLFDKTQKYKRRGEASVFYLYYYEEAIKNILNYLDKKIKIIIVLRNPIERAFSAYKHVVSNNPSLMVSFEEALRKEDEYMASTQITPMAHYKSMGLYYKMVRAYKENFDNVHVLLYDDLKKNTSQEIINIFNFLELEQEKIDISTRYNTGRNAWSSKWVGTLVLKDTIVKRNMKKLPFFSYFKNLILEHSTHKFEKMSQATKQELIEFYAYDIQKLSKFLDIDLSNWLKVNK